MDIDDLKLILLEKSFSEIEEALRHFDINSFDRNGNNILHYYVNNSESVKVPVEDMIQLLLDFGININATQLKLSKRTALHLAVLGKSKDVFDVLLKRGADVNVQDGNGNAPLFNAVI